MFANEVEKKFIDSGLINVHTIDASIQVDLVNADATKNFFGEDYYGGLDKAYLRKEIAVKLHEAQKLLTNKYPGLSLLILDAARPRSVSRLMYEKMKGTKFEKYVANPTKGSMHNYGTAVDITIVDSKAQHLDMGYSPFYKGKFDVIWQYVKKKIGFEPNKAQQENRAMLFAIMVKAGFIPLSFEWWHFYGLEKSLTRKKYKIIE